MLSARNVGSAIIDFVVVKPTCDRCQLLELWLEEEKTKREFYEKIYLTKTGAFSDPEVAVTTEDFKSIRRFTKPSDIIRQATILRAKEAVAIANDNEKTTAEKVFEESLKEVSH